MSHNDISTSTVYIKSPNNPLLGDFKSTRENDTFEGDIKALREVFLNIWQVEIDEIKATGYYDNIPEEVPEWKNTEEYNEQIKIEDLRFKNNFLQFYKILFESMRNSDFTIQKVINEIEN